MTAVPGAGGRTRWGLPLGLAALAGGLALVTSATLRDGGGGPSIDPVTHFLLAVAVILIVSHLCGEVMRRIGQPPVLGEIVGGLLLGQSALGLLWPAARDWLFPADVLHGLNMAAQLGLVVFMFLLGCELRTDRIDRPRVVSATVVGGMGLPFVAGAGLAWWAGGVLSGDSGRSETFVLYFGLALAVTAMPVLARILLDLNLAGTRVGALSLTSAATGDGVAWIALTLILAGTAGGGGAVAETAGAAVALVLVMAFCVRPALASLIPRIRSERMLTMTLVAGALAFAGLTQMMHLHPIIGAFLFGATVPRDSPAVARISGQLQGFTLTVLLPLFFAGVGLTTAIGLLGTQVGHWLLFVAVLVVAHVTKWLGAGGAARLAGLPGRESLQVGVLMNCRGVTELVVASIGLQAGIINELGFTVLVLVAVVSTAITTPLMRRLMQQADTRLPERITS